MLFIHSVMTIDNVPLTIHDDDLCCDSVSHDNVIPFYTFNDIHWNYTFILLILLLMIVIV